MQLLSQFNTAHGIWTLSLCLFYSESIACRISMDSCGQVYGFPPLVIYLLLFSLLHPTRTLLLDYTSFRKPTKEGTQKFNVLPRDYHRNQKRPQTKKKESLLSLKYISKSLKCVYFVCIEIMNSITVNTATINTPLDGQQNQLLISTSIFT